TLLLLRRKARKSVDGRGRRGRRHVDFGPDPYPGGPGGIVEVEVDALALPEHAEDRTVEGVVGQVEFEAIGVADDDALAGRRVIGLDHALHAAARSSVVRFLGSARWRPGPKTVVVVVSSLPSHESVKCCRRRHPARCGSATTPRSCRAASCWRP